MWNTIAGLLLLGIPSCASIGCGAPQAMPKEFAEVARSVGASIADQAVWQEVLARIDGEVIEPGIEGYAGVLYVAGGKLTGASGRIRLEGDGTGSGALSPEARAAILSEFTEPGLADRIIGIIERRAATIE